MMKYSCKNKMKSLFPYLIFILIWEIGYVTLNDEIYLPSIVSVLNSLEEIIVKKDFGIVIYSSFIRTILSYILGVTLATILGMISISSNIFKSLFEPFNIIIRTIPNLVLILLVLIWFNKEYAPFILGLTITFPIIYEGVQNSILNIDIKIIDMIKIYDVNYKDKIKKIYIPTIKSYLSKIFISTFSLTFKIVIAGEVFAQPRFGIGSEIQIYKVNFNTAGIFAWIIIIIMISLLFEYGDVLIQRIWFRWFK